MTALADYLGETSRRRWQPGAFDCCIFIADWLLRLGLPDVMADRRGSYASEREYRAALRSEGGLVQSCARRFSAAGLGETRMPRAGDVGLAWMPFAARRGKLLFRATGAIAATDRHFAIPTMKGVVGVRSDRLWRWKAWSVPHA